MPSEKMTLESLRDELPITGKVAYLNTGSHGPPPDSVLASVAEEMALQAHNYGMPSVSAPQGAREKAAREGLARFIGAKPEEVAMTPNTTQAMRQVSQSIAGARATTSWLRRWSTSAPSRWARRFSRTWA